MAREASYCYQRPPKGDCGQAGSFRDGIFSRAAFYDLLVLPFGDLDRVHLALRADLIKSEAISAVPFCGVVPPRPEKKEAECQQRAKRNQREMEKKMKIEILLGSLA